MQREPLTAVKGIELSESELECFLGLIGVEDVITKMWHGIVTRIRRIVQVKDLMDHYEDWIRLPFDKL